MAEIYVYHNKQTQIYTHFTLHFIEKELSKISHNMKRHPTYALSQHGQNFAATHAHERYLIMQIFYVKRPVSHTNYIVIRRTKSKL